MPKPPLGQGKAPTLVDQVLRRQAGAATVASAIHEPLLERVITESERGARDSARVCRGDDDASGDGSSTRVVEVHEPRDRLVRDLNVSGSAKEEDDPVETGASCLALGVQGSCDIVQFESPMFYVEEEEGSLSVGVMRLGSMKGEVRVDYQSFDGTAKAGVRYEPALGTLRFKDNEDLKSIKIKIIEDENWATTVEFKVHLSNAVNCELGKYLHHCRVKVIDNDCFPSSKYAEKILEGTEGIEKIPIVGLLWEYFKLNFRVKGLAWRTVTLVLLKQLENLYILFTLFMTVYFVDVLFNQKEKETEAKLFLWSRTSTAVLIGAGYIVPMIALHLIDLQAVRLDVGGMSREFLQANLFRKYLNFGDKVRGDLSPASMQVAILQDTGEVVEGYLAALELIKAFFKIAFTIYFILAENRNALLPVILMPLMMLIFVWIRTEALIEACEKAASSTAGLFEVVQEACHKYTVIAEYAQRPQMCDKFQEALERLNHAVLPAELVKTNNNYFPKWLGPTFTGIYIALSARAVLNGSVSLGAFVATTRIFKELSEQFSEMYNELMKIASGCGPLRKLTDLFNLPTDAKHWKKVNRWRRERTKDLRSQIYEVEGLEEKMREHNVAFRSDLIEIQCVNLAFGYEKRDTLLHNVNVAVSQGKIVAVVGAHGNGRSTFLRILGHQLFPDEGHVMIPTYLRILHISKDPVLLGFSVVENLTFGDPRADPDLVKKIMTELGMNKVMDMAEEAWARKGNNACNEASSESSKGGGEDEIPAENWGKKLNYVEIAKIHLARALIVNPEVLILQRPLIHFDDDEADRVRKVLFHHIRNRGLCLPKETAARRRPRTLFFSPSSEREATQADVLWEVTDKTVKSMQPEELREKHLDLQ